MNEQTDDWNDLAKMWQADAARVSTQEIDAHLRREKRLMAKVAAAELLGLCAGIVAAACVLFFTPHTGTGVAIVLFGGGSAWLTLRLRREFAPPVSLDLLQSLKESIAREDWLSEQLRFGRALSFVALFAIVMAIALQLLRTKAFSAVVLAAAGIGCAVVLMALAWNLLLTSRSRRRRQRLRYLDQRLKA